MFYKKILKFNRPVMNTRGEFYVDTVILLIISVVVGGLLMAGLYELFNGQLLPLIAQRIGNTTGV